MPRTAKAQKAKKTGSYEALRKRLDEQRLEIMSLYENDLRVGQKNSDQGAEDLVDRANSAYNREFMLSLSGGERENLLEIENALERIEDGSYGICAHCAQKITLRRLQAVPWARYCIDCQELVEQGELFDE